MKLYFPTSSLNLGTILATESFSPASFYQTRSFCKTNSFEKVGPNPYDDITLLFDKVPTFSIEDSQQDNYPMVIEVDNFEISHSTPFPLGQNQEKFNFSGQEVGIYQTYGTLYVNPWTSKFIFRNQKERDIALSKIQFSLDCKLVDLYKQRFVVLNPSSNFVWEDRELPIERNEDKNFEFEQDLNVNRLKGLMWGYAIGSSLKVANRSDYEKKHLLEELSSYWKNSKSKSTDELKRLQLKYLDVYKEDWLSSFNSSKEDCKGFLSIASNFPAKIVDDIVKELLITSPNSLKRPLIGEFDINSYLKSLTSNEWALNYQKSVILDSDCGVEFVSIEEKIDKSIWVPVLNSYLESNSCGEIFLEDRSKFALMVGKEIKAFFQNKNAAQRWEDSPIQVYLNNLLKNLRSPLAAFDANSYDKLHSIVVFAAFCQAGDKDTAKLQKYLEKLQVLNPTLAYVLWGLVFGYDNITSLHFKELRSSCSEQEFKDVYCYIYEQVHKVSIASLINEEVKNVTTVSEVERKGSQSEEGVKQENPTQTWLKSLQKKKLSKTINEKVKEYQKGSLFNDDINFILSDLISNTRDESIISKLLEDFPRDLLQFKDDQYLEMKLRKLYPDDEYKKRSSIIEQVKYFKEQKVKEFSDKSNLSLIEKFIDWLERKKNNQKVPTNLQKLLSEANFLSELKRRLCFLYKVDKSLG